MLGASLPPCFVDLPVYDAGGNRTSFKISEVSPEGERQINLTTVEQLRYRVVARGTRLYFHRAMIGKRRIEVTLQDSKARKVVRRVALMNCRQKTSFREGMADTGLDVSWSVVRGRLTGCRFAGDWWIRAVPMFDGHETAIIHEGIIDPDGSFQITSSFTGERHIIVVGRDKDPVQAFAANVVAGRDNELGTKDIQNACPQP